MVLLRAAALVGLVVAAALGQVAVAQDLRYCGRAPGVAAPPHPLPLTHDPATGDPLALVQVQILHRHGDRTSTQSEQCWVGDDDRFECPLEPSTAFLDRNVTRAGVPRLYRKVYVAGEELTPGDCFIGQLTTAGYEQHLANGADLRTAYVDTGFLRADFDDREVYLRSTDVPRTVQSVSALVQGLYPAAFGPDGQTRVVDIHTRDSATEDMVPQSAAWVALNAQAQNSSGYIAGMQPYAPVEQAIFAAVNTSITDFGALTDCLNAHACHGFPLPIDWSLFDAMTRGVAWAAYYLYTWPSVQVAARTGLGPYYRTVHDRLAAAVAGRSAVKLHVDSGHDSSVMPFVAGLQVGDGLWASYAVYTTIELYRSAAAPSGYAVRFVYRGVDVAMPYCSQPRLCDWAEFAAYLRSISPADDEPRAARRRVSGEVADAPQRFF